MNQTHNLKKFHISIAILTFIVWAFFGLHSIYAETLTFGSTLTGLFPGIDTNYSTINFQYGGNNQIGVIFWTDNDILSTPESITINGGTQTITCNTKLNGLYYSNARGQTIWPLDTGNRQILVNSGPYTDYAALVITWGLYTNCTSGGGSFVPDTNAIFGEIDHTISGTQYHIFAGLAYNFSNNTLVSNGTAFVNNFYMMNNGSTVTGFLYDTYGGIGFVGSGGQWCTSNCTRTASQICSWFDISPATITYGANTNFTCTGNNQSGYQLSINNGYTSSAGTGRTTGSALPVGTYQVACMAVGGGTCMTKSLTVNTAPTIVGSCGLAGNTAIVQVPGSIAQASSLMPDYYYSKTTGNINIQIRSNMPASYSITSSGIVNSITGTYNGSYNPPATPANTGTLILTSGDGQKQITTTFSTGTCSATSLKWITLDLLPPTTPTLTYPIGGSGICYVGNFNFTWNAAADSGIGVSTYNYKIASNPYFTSPIINGSTTWTTFSLNASQLGTWYFSGVYYREVAAVDGLLQTGTYATGQFTVNIDNCTNTGSIIIHGTIPRVRNADLNKEYLSDPFTVDNLPWQIIAYISTGILYINGSGNSTSGYINNGDELNIKLRSSTQYDTNVSSIFYVGPKHATFNLTTRSLTGYSPTSGCDLATGQRAAISDIFANIQNTYSGNIQTMFEFLFTMQSMLNDEIALSGNCALAYLLDNVNAYIIDNIGQSIDESDHEAPNCKIYQVAYDGSKQGYTSPNFKKKIYFAARGALTRYIDSKNLGDCYKNTYTDLPTFDNTWGSGDKYIAPNGKIYAIKEKIISWSTTGYYSPDFTKIKYFENIDDLYKLIDANNPIQEIRDHTIDITFIPITYITNNNKEYRIYKTDKGYMSYKLMTIQYFDTLWEIKNYINQHNK